MAMVQDTTRPLGPAVTRIGVERALLSLAGLSVVGVLAISGMFDVASDASGIVVTFVLMGTPMAMFLAVALVRSGYVFPASAFAITTAAVGAIVAALLEPSLAAAASTYLMLAAILVVGSNVMPFRYAAALGAFNLAAAVALPSFAPQAGSTAVQIPYVFLFSNAMLLLFASILRSNDHAKLKEVEDQANVLEVRYDLLRAAADHMQFEHRGQVRHLKDKNDNQRHLLDAASHELRTPITPLLLQVAAFRKRYDPRLDDDQRKSLELLERNLRRMALLVGDLLDVASLENGQLVLRPKAADLATLAAQTRDTFVHQAQEAGVQVMLDVPAGLTVNADATRLSQVLYNLVSNAVKFSKEGGTVTLSARANAGGVHIEVQDDGMGFEPGRQRELFQPFGRVHDNHVKGTGLGLYICRGIISQHGGQIWARSDGVGHGATFGVWLPEDGPRVALSDEEAPRAARIAQATPT